MSLQLQPKLLRVLENGEFSRVGETHIRHSDARVIAVTNRNLKQEVKAGRFRTDLYHRLSVIIISVPPLRERADDKLLMLDHFRSFYARQSSTAQFEMQDDALALWKKYPFPGNVRELRNIVIRLATKYSGRTVSAAQLEVELDAQEQPQAVQAFGRNFASMLEVARAHLRDEGGCSLDQTLRQWEKAYIEVALDLNHGNLSRTAKMLGINRTTLYSRLQALTRAAIEDGRFPSGVN
jgi:DNA-binding NtrC family response regulator